MGCRTVCSLRRRLHSTAPDARSSTAGCTSSSPSLGCGHALGSPGALPAKEPQRPRSCDILLDTSILLSILSMTLLISCPTPYYIAMPLAIIFGMGIRHESSRSAARRVLRHQSLGTGERLYHRQIHIAVDYSPMRTTLTSNADTACAGGGTPCGSPFVLNFASVPSWMTYLVNAGGAPYLFLGSYPSGGGPAAQSYRMSGDFVSGNSHCNYVNNTYGWGCANTSDD